MCMNVVLKEMGVRNLIFIKIFIQDLKFLLSGINHDIFSRDILKKI